MSPNKPGSIVSEVRGEFGSMIQILFGLFLVLALTRRSEAERPNIIFVLADDLGYNDVPWNNPDILAPNLHKLATENGAVLDQSYVQPGCSPSRAALLTGYLPIRNGIRAVLGVTDPVGLYTNFTLLPQYMKNRGYETHMLGKWHLGWCHPDYIPTRRGFDHFHGFWLGSQGYYTHERTPKKGNQKPGYDYRKNEDTDWSVKGKYSTFIMQDTMAEVIGSANPEIPFFVYLSMQSPHGPMDVPQRFVDKYRDKPHLNEARRIYSAQVTAMDEMLGNMVQNLKAKGIYDNTIIIFASDNGGTAKSGGNNLPLRGLKGTDFEGGTRSATLIHSPLLNINEALTASGIIHVTDWLPTIYAMAGGDPITDLPDVDGINQWDFLKDLSNRRDKSNRNEMLYNYRDEDGEEEDGKQVRAALRIGDLKLIQWAKGKNDGWVPLEKVIKGKSEYSKKRMKEFENVDWASGEDRRQYKLYNLTSDPSEKIDISGQHPELVQQLAERIKSYAPKAIPRMHAKESTDGNPNKSGGVYETGWCQSFPGKDTSGSSSSQGTPVSSNTQTSQAAGNKKETGGHRTGKSASSSNVVTTQDAVTFILSIVHIFL